MAVLKMQRISICALKKDRKAILEKLQSLGVVEIRHWGFWMITLRRKSHYFLRWKEKN